MWDDILTALALVLVIEGLLPIISPAHYRRAITSLISQHDRTLRTIGLSSMITGAILLAVIH